MKRLAAAEPLAPRRGFWHLDVDPADLRCCSASHAGAQRLRQQLAAEAMADHRDILRDGVAQQARQRLDPRQRIGRRSSARPSCRCRSTRAGPPAPELLRRRRSAASRRHAGRASPRSRRDPPTVRSGRRRPASSNTRSGHSSRARSRARCARRPNGCGSTRSSRPRPRTRRCAASAASRTATPRTRSSTKRGLS